MTRRNKDRIITFILSICLLLIGTGVGRLTKHADETSNKLQEKFKLDIKQEVQKELEPKFDKKLDKVIFDEHVKSQNREYKMLIEKIETYNNNVNNRFTDIKSNQKETNKLLVSIINSK